MIINLHKALGSTYIEHYLRIRKLKVEKRSKKGAAKRRQKDSRTAIRFPAAPTARMTENNERALGLTATNASATWKSSSSEKQLGFHWASSTLRS